MSILDMHVSLLITLLSSVFDSIWLIFTIRDVQQFYLNVSSWMCKMDSLNDMDLEKSLQNANVLLKGYDYANEISNTFTVLTNMSANMGKVMSKSNVLALCHLIELLKAIEIEYHKKKEFLIFAIQYILQDLLNKLLGIIQAARVSINKASKFRIS